MNGTNASYYPEMTNLLKEICSDITKNIIKEGQPIVLIDAFDWYRECSYADLQRSPLLDL